MIPHADSRQSSGKNGEPSRLSLLYEDLPPKPAGDSAPSSVLMDEIRSEVTVRRIAGGLMGSVGVGVVIVVILFASLKINDAIDPAKYPAGAHYLSVVAMAAHALISLGAVWFGYQMLRAAERMFVPRRLLDDARDVELLRALIGIHAPTSAMADQLKSLSASGPALLKAAAALAKAARGEKA